MENVIVLSRKQVTMDKFVSQAKIVVEGQIKKVLGVSACGVVGNCDFLNGFCQVGGKVKLNAIYLLEDGTISRGEAFSDFGEKQQAAFALENAFATDRVEVSNFSVSDSEIICFLEHNVTVSGNLKYETCDVGASESEFVTNKKDLTALKFVAGGDDGFVVAEEVSSNVTGAVVLSSSAEVAVSEISCVVDKVAVSGKVLANVVYSDAEGVSSLAREFEFKQEIAVNGALPNMLADATLFVKNLTVTPEENNDKTNFVFVCDLGAKCSVYDEANYSVVTDIFSLKNELQTTYSFLELNSFAGYKNFSDTVMQTSDVSSLKDFDDIVGVFEPKFTVSGIERVEDKFVISGVIDSLVIYKSTEDVASYSSRLETKIEVAADPKLSLFDLGVAVSVTSFKVKAGKDLEVMFNLDCTAKFESEVSEKYVKAIEVKEEKATDFSGIRVYVTSGKETVFDVARNLNVRPELITAQNEVSDAFEQGEKIYVYSPLIFA